MYINLYQAFILAAMKMHTYVRAAKQAEYGGKGSLAFLPSASETSPATSKGDRKQRQKRTLQKRIENRGSSAFLLSELMFPSFMCSFTSKPFNKRLITYFPSLPFSTTEAIRRSVSSTYSAILNKAQGRLAQESGGRCELSQDEVVWYVCVWFLCGACGNWSYSSWWCAIIAIYLFPIGSAHMPSIISWNGKVRHILTVTYLLL